MARALCDLGFDAQRQLSVSDAARLRAAFVKCEASRDGLVRGKPHTMLNDGDIDQQRHIRGAVGAIAASVVNDTVLVSTVNTNLLGNIRVTSAFIEHLKKQPSATIIYNTSVLGYVPLAVTAVYSATKAALHSFVLSQRYALRSTGISVLEIAPPWVRTDLLGSSNESRAMPLAEFIDETIDVLGTNANEILVERAKPLRNNPGPNEGALVTQFNDLFLQPQS